jgi:hypothetical protein
MACFQVEWQAIAALILHEAVRLKQCEQPTNSDPFISGLEIATFKNVSKFLVCHLGDYEDTSLYTLKSSLYDSQHFSLNVKAFDMSINRQSENNVFLRNNIV